MPHRVQALVLLTAISLVAGCSKSEFDVAPASGKVSCKGAPVTFGTVTFSPLQGTGKGGNPGKAASGNIDSNGEFVLSTYGADDGAVVGRHQVIISSPDPKQPLPCAVGQKPAIFELEVVDGDNNFDIRLEDASKK